MLQKLEPDTGDLGPTKIIHVEWMIVRKSFLAKRAFFRMFY